MLKRDKKVIIQRLADHSINTNADEAMLVSMPTANVGTPPQGSAQIKIILFYKNKTRPLIWIQSYVA